MAELNRLRIVLKPLADPKARVTHYLSGRPWNKWADGVPPLILPMQVRARRELAALVTEGCRVVQQTMAPDGTLTVVLDTTDHRLPEPKRESGLTEALKRFRGKHKFVGVSGEDLGLVDG